MKVDLHLHTTASDGKLNPKELVYQAALLGLVVIAITDHDTVGGILPALEAAKDFPQLRVIPGVEISTELHEGEAHILGYFINYNHTHLNNMLHEIQTVRFERAKKMVNKLNNMNINIKWEIVQEIAGEGSVGRPHIAQALVKAGYILTLREAFNKYIGRECPSYVPRKKVTPTEAIELIVDANGLPVLAHPADIKNLDSFVATLKEAGLKGMEIYYNGYSSNTIDHLLNLAHKHSLVISGGSDYHGLDDSAGTNLGSVNIPDEIVSNFLAYSK